MKGRRTNGDGKLRQREDGRWECTIMDGYKPDGRRCLKSFYGRTKTEAQKKKNEYLRAKEMGLLVDAEYLFPEWADMWYENHKRELVKGSILLLHYISTSNLPILCFFRVMR